VHLPDGCIAHIQLSTSAALVELYCELRRDLEEGAQFDAKCGFIS
jgi:hypothetical protein